MEPRDVLFIDEIHRVNRVVEEYLYSAMEDFKIDIIIDQGPAARSVSVPLEPFTLIGATTRQGLLTSPMRARFGLNAHLDYYSVAELAAIVKRDARLLNLSVSESGRDGTCPSLRRGTARIAKRWLRRARAILPKWKAKERSMPRWVQKGTRHPRCRRDGAR